MSVSHAREWFGVKRVNVVVIPKDKTNIWGLPEFVLGDIRYCVVDAMVDKEHHRLVTATWYSASWESFVGYVRDTTCNISWRESGTSADGLSGKCFVTSRGRATAVRMLRGATPETLQGLVNKFRAEEIGLDKVGLANIVYCENDQSVHFFTVAGNRHFIWRDYTVRVDFGEAGSHGLLKTLISVFDGLPFEALKLHY